MKILIMAGGQGTRFWPRSVASYPKQFLALTSEETMLQQTYRRFRESFPESAVYIVTITAYRDLVMEQLPMLSPDQLILEPEPKDTGPCVAISAQHFLLEGDDDVLVMAPSDQYVPDAKKLMEALIQAEQVAKADRAIVTLGIVPTRPETGYGYIQALPPAGKQPHLPVAAFIEKPPLEKALQLFQQPHMYWNSGIFIWKASTIAYYMQKHQPKLWMLVSECGRAWSDIYPKLDKISVDYAILEKAERIYTIPISFEWDDVGLWTSLERIYAANEKGNIVSGCAHLVNSENNIIYSDHHPALIIGVSNLIIVSTEHGLLVCDKAQEQEIKEALKAMPYHKGGRIIP